MARVWTLVAHLLALDFALDSFRDRVRAQHGAAAVFSSVSTMLMAITRRNNTTECDVKSARHDPMIAIE